jgi:putative oxidoreductase
VLKKALQTHASGWVVLIRLAAGAVFLSEGIQKFIYPQLLGAGRFARIGLPAPEILAPFVGFVELGCGALLILGLLTRWAAVALICDMVVAILTTKIPMLLKVGFWAMAHEARTDYSMLLACLFLLIVGAGRVSVDALLAPLPKTPPPEIPPPEPAGT